jgi:uncharacterized membrane protein
MALGVFLLVLSAAVTHSLWNFFTRVVKGNIAVVWLALLVGSAACFPFTLLRGWTVQSLSAGYPYLIATGVINAVYFRLLAWCYEHGEISVIYPVARGTGVAGATLLAYFLTSEVISTFGATGIALVCVGTILVGFSGFNLGRLRIRAGFMALSVGIVISIYSVVDKAGVGFTDPVNFIFVKFFLAAVMLSPYVIRRHRPAVQKALKSLKRYVLLIGLGSIGTYLIILFAFQQERLSYVVAVRESAVIIGAVLGLTLLKEDLTFKKILGIIAITAGVILIKVA